MERVFDICSHQLGIPGDQMRLRNYIRDFPYETPNGCVYDSGDFPKMMEMAKKLVGWDEWKKKQEAARKEGRWLGIGIGTTLDSGTNNFGQARIINSYLPFSGNSEVANVKLDIDGTVVVTLGTVPQGQSPSSASSPRWSRCVPDSTPSGTPTPAIPAPTPASSRSPGFPPSTGR
jgi:2-furoyl-CoA dehydrogenase large subunit